MFADISAQNIYCERRRIRIMKWFRQYTAIRNMAEQKNTLYLGRFGSDAVLARSSAARSASQS